MINTFNSTVRYICIDTTSASFNRIGRMVIDVFGILIILESLKITRVIPSTFLFFKIKL